MAMVSTIVPRAVPTYRGTSLIRNSASLGLNSRNMPRALWFLMSEVPMYPPQHARQSSHLID